MIMPGRDPEVGDPGADLHPAVLPARIAPQTVLAAYRVGDGPVNVITPLMVYLPFIVLVCQRYRKSAGMGTVVSMMMPYTVIVLVTWTLYFSVWYLIGHPVGSGRTGPSRPRHGWTARLSLIILGARRRPVRVEPTPRRRGRGPGRPVPVGDRLLASPRRSWRASATRW